MNKNRAVIIIMLPYIDLDVLRPYESTIGNILQNFFISDKRDSFL